MHSEDYDWNPVTQQWERIVPFTESGKFADEMPDSDYYGV